MKIFQKDEKVLRQIARDVPVVDIISPKIKKVVEKMREALHSQDDGVAIAAPQIGESWRIFVVSGRVFDPTFVKEGIVSEKQNGEDVVFINPKFKKLSKKKSYMAEGCLSVRWLYGKVNRSNNATIEAYDQNGKKFTRGAGGLLAQIFQHETDHLDGVLFIDKARDIENIPPPPKTKKST